jgi:hypothetical protein
LNPSTDPAPGTRPERSPDEAASVFLSSGIAELDTDDKAQPPSEGRIQGTQ